MLILHKLLRSDILTSDPEEHENGKFMLIRDVEDYQQGLYDKHLTCFGCGIGWFLFLLGYVFLVMWYYTTVLYFGNYNHKDPRERAGLAASAIAIPDDRRSFVKTLARGKPIDDDDDLLTIAHKKECENQSGVDVASL
ncbi:hypothetical protein GIB67_032319, partial [Kingdonia uniflora]